MNREEKIELIRDILTGKRSLPPNQIITAIEQDKPGVFDVVMRTRSGTGWKQKEMIATLAELDQLDTPRTRAFIITNL